MGLFSVNGSPPGFPGKEFCESQLLGEGRPLQSPRRAAEGLRGRLQAVILRYQFFDERLCLGGPWVPP